VLRFVVLMGQCCNVLITHVCNRYAEDKQCGLRRVAERLHFLLQRMLCLLCLFSFVCYMSVSSISHVVNMLVVSVAVTIRQK
jgi:hypothetical protein